MAAARRISKSAVDWVQFAERVPRNQKEAFRALKMKNDEFVTKLHQYPEEMSKIDFAMYRSRLASPALADEMEKGFKALNIPYPQDPDNLKSEIDGMEKASEVETKAEVASLKAFIAQCNDVVKTFDEMPTLDKVTYETYFEYFPDEHENLQESFYPHTADFQGDLTENNPYGRSTMWKDFKSWAYKLRKYVPGVPDEAKWRPDPEGERRRAYMDQPDAGH